MNFRAEELAEDVASLISDQIGAQMGPRGGADIPLTVINSRYQGNVAILYIEGGGQIRVTVEISADP